MRSTFARKLGWLLLQKNSISAFLLVTVIPLWGCATETHTVRGGTDIDAIPTPKPRDPQLILKPPVIASWKPGENRRIWALVVGVSEYRDPAVPNLESASADAKSIYAWLTEKDGLNLGKEQVRFLLDKEATLSGIKTALEELKRKGIVKQDLLFVYFSGHGHGAPGIATDGSCLDAKYLLTCEAKHDNLEGTALEANDLFRCLDYTGAESQAVILETCFAGAVANKVLEGATIRDVTIRPKSLIKATGERCRIILCATTGNQINLALPERLGKGNRGLFTDYFLQAMYRGQTKSINQAYNDLTDRVRKGAKELGSVQDPQRIGDADLDIILVGS